MNIRSSWHFPGARSQPGTSLRIYQSFCSAVLYGGDSIARVNIERGKEGEKTSQQMPTACVRWILPDKILFVSTRLWGRAVTVMSECVAVCISFHFMPPRVYCKWETVCAYNCIDSYVSIKYIAVSRLQVCYRSSVWFSVVQRAFICVREEKCFTSETTFVLLFVWFLAELLKHEWSKRHPVSFLHLKLNTSRNGSKLDVLLCFFRWHAWCTVRLFRSSPVQSKISNFHGRVF